DLELGVEQRPGEHRLGRDDGEGGRPDGIAPGERRVVLVRRRRVGTDRVCRHLVRGGGVRLARKRGVDCQRKPPFQAPLSYGAPHFFKLRSPVELLFSSSALLWSSAIGFVSVQAPEDMTPDHHPLYLA